MNSYEKFDKIYKEKDRLDRGKTIYNKISEDPVIKLKDHTISLNGFVSQTTLDFVTKLLLEEYKQNLQAAKEKFDKMLEGIDV